MVTFIFLSLQSALKQSLHSCPLFIGIHVTYFTLLAVELTPIRCDLPLFTDLPRGRFLGKPSFRRRGFLEICLATFGPAYLRALLWVVILCL
jgi:hypothetical protein